MAARADDWYHVATATADDRGRLADDGLLGRLSHRRQFDDAPLAFDPEGGRLSGEQRAGDNDHDRGHAGVRLVAVQEVEPGRGGDGGAAHDRHPCRTDAAGGQERGDNEGAGDVGPAGEGQVDHGQDGQHRRRHSHPAELSNDRCLAVPGALFHGPSVSSGLLATGWATTH